MSETGSRLGRTVRNLLLALLNATLILFALCLYLGLELATTVDSVTANISKNLVGVESLRGDFQEMTSEMAALRADLKDSRSQPGGLPSEAADRLTDKLNAIDARMTAATSNLEAVVSEPTALIDHAVTSAATQIKQAVAEFQSCQAPSGS
ncbi:MAG: hypothetical protein Kilf2KO_24000 [Rhodospirillales bacterium]